MLITLCKQCTATHIYYNFVIKRYNSHKAFDIKTVLAIQLHPHTFCYYYVCVYVRYFWTLTIFRCVRPCQKYMSLYPFSNQYSVKYSRLQPKPIDVNERNFSLLFNIQLHLYTWFGSIVCTSKDLDTQYIFTIHSTDNFIFLFYDFSVIEYT